MKLFEIRKCEPEDIETEIVVVTKFEESVSGDYDLLRGTKILIANNKSSDKIKFHPDCEYVYEINLSLHEAYCFNHFDVEYYKKALLDCVNYARGDNPKSIALPLVSFDSYRPELEINENDDSIEFTIELGFNLCIGSAEPINVVFYTNDENLDFEKLKERARNYICNTYLKDYDNEEVNYKSEKSNENSSNCFDDRLKDFHLPLDTFIEKYSGKSFEDYVNDYLNSTNIKSSGLYKKAQISKQDYHKMMTNPSLPNKQKKQKYDTVALLLSSNPDINKFKEMLASRGFALSDCLKKDLIIKYYIMNGNCKVSEINEELEKRNLPVIGNSLI